MVVIMLMVIMPMMLMTMIVMVVIMLVVIRFKFERPVVKAGRKPHQCLTDDCPCYKCSGCTKKWTKRCPTAHSSCSEYYFQKGISCTIVNQFHANTCREK